jgi:hypothetical protein
MTNKLSKCVIVFSVTVTISLASMAFFNQMMNMPSKAMMMGSTMMQGQDKPCDCNCKKLN